MRKLLVTAVSALALAACAAKPDVSPGQQLVNTVGTSCQGLGDAIRATDQAVLNGLIKKAAAQEAIKGFTAAQVGCVTALGTIQAAQPAASAASGVAP